MPFNPDQSIEAQVRESIQQSLDHLQVDYIDALLLHTPFDADDDNLTAWRVFETFTPHKIRYLGVSNFTLSRLVHLYYRSTIKPSIVQNRFVRSNSYDIALRQFCRDHHISYQAYGMLRGNPEILQSELIQNVATTHALSKEAAFYVLILGLGGTHVLDGTTNPEHMAQDTQQISMSSNTWGPRANLQPFVDEFRQLLWELASSAEARLRKGNN